MNPSALRCPGATTLTIFVHKVRKSLGLIHRNVCNCPKYVRNQAHGSLVCPILEHACCESDPHQCKHTKPMECVQRHAVRFTTGNYHSMNPGCVTNMITKLCWDLLEHRRLIRRITMFYEIISNLASIPVHHQLKVHDSSTHGSASHRFRQLNTTLRCDRYSFLPATIVSWNNLPLEVRQLPSFQHALSKSVYHQFCINDLGFSLILCLHREFRA